MLVVAEPRVVKVVTLRLVMTVTEGLVEVFVLLEVAVLLVDNEVDCAETAPEVLSF